RASSAPPGPSAVSHSRSSTRLCSWMRSTRSTRSRSSERRTLARALSAVRSPVLVARKKRSRCRSIHGPTRSSESPYEAGVSMWLTPWSSRSWRIWSAFSCRIAPSAAAPKITRLLSCPVRPNASVSIAPPMPPSRSVEPPALALPPQRRDVDAEPGGGLLQRGRLREHLAHVTLLQVLERRARRRRRSVGRRRHEAIGKVLRPDRGAAGQNHGALEGVHEFAHVARPAVRGERRARGVVQGEQPAAMPGAQAREDGVDQRPQVLQAVTQRGQPERDHVHAAEESLTEAPRAHLPPH